MANQIKESFLANLREKFGAIKKLDGSLSLFEIGSGTARIYIRYSKVHGRNTTFYGLRHEDLKLLEGQNSFICFLWDGQTSPLLIPYSEYEEVFAKMKPAKDGQFKVQVYPEPQGTEFYIANAGRFNVEDHFGWHRLQDVFQNAGQLKMPELNHSQVQTLLGAIGTAKGFDIWVPTVDRNKLDWKISRKFQCSDILPYDFEPIKFVLQEIDVVWLQRGSGQISAMFEVEHSTPIYSGLLRFNDIHLVSPALKPRFNIVANDSRRDIFVRNLNRPTFRTSGLSELCSFLEYVNVYGWFNRITNENK
jgi:hypothetical protein